MLPFSSVTNVPVSDGLSPPPPALMKAIASSGEMARVMLALKTVLSSQDSIPILVFDEVDANIGGETATVVGQKMSQIGKKSLVVVDGHKRV